MAQAERIRFTRRDLELWPDDGKRRELIDGDIYVAPAPSWQHQRILVTLGFELGLFLRQNPIGQFVLAPLDVMLEGDDTVQPDLVYVSNERREIITNRGLVGAPDWAVEVLSPSNREHDLETKRRLYRRNGVPVYWIVDPFERVVLVYEGEAESRLEPGDTAGVSSVPGFVLEVGRLFE